MADRLTWYTIIAAFWMAFLAILGVNMLGNYAMFGELFAPKEVKVEKFGFPVEVIAEEEASSGEPVVAERVSSVPLIAAASLDEGAAVFKKCGACHTVEAGGANRVGPNLHNIVGTAIGDFNGFKASESLKAVGGDWTYERLDDYLENPKRLAPKGIMSFAGLKKLQDRAAVIKFLMSQTDNPPPLPAAEEPTQ